MGQGKSFFFFFLNSAKREGGKDEIWEGISVS